jgi:hypothetical protein
LKILATDQSIFYRTNKNSFSFINDSENPEKISYFASFGPDINKSAQIALAHGYTNNENQHQFIKLSGISN